MILRLKRVIYQNSAGKRNGETAAVWVIRLNIQFAMIIDASRFTDFSALQFLVRARIRVIRVNLDQWKRTFVRISGKIQVGVIRKKNNWKVGSNLREIGLSSSYPTLNYRASTVILLHTSGGRRGVNSSNSVDTRVFGHILKYQVHSCNTNREEVAEIGSDVSAEGTNF